MIVDLDKLRAALEYCRAINSEYLIDIEWQQDGKLIKLSRELIEKWALTGLDNIDFARTHLLIKSTDPTSD